jgi:hypothetical protein
LRLPDEIKNLRDEKRIFEGEKGNKRSDVWYYNMLIRKLNEN